MRQLQRERRQRSVPGRDESTIVYGALPPKLFAYVRRRGTKVAAIICIDYAHTREGRVMALTG